MSSSLPDWTEVHLSPRPIHRATTLPASWYTHGGIAALEQRALFQRGWHLVAHAGQLADPGRIIPVSVAGRSLVLVNDQGELRAFHNVCRHRAGPLATEAGCGQRLTCQYHGWSYELDGRLADMGDFGEAEGMDTSRIRLRPAALCRWHGLIFASLNPSAAPPESLFDTLDENLADVAMDTLGFDRRVVYEVECNWKAYVDNYLEGYHVPAVHPGLGEQLRFEDYRTEVFDDFSLQSSPLDQAITQGGQAMGQARYFFIYPSLMLNVLPERLQTNVVIPLGTERCRVVFDYYYSDAVSRADRDADQDSAHQTQLEDIAICEQVQGNLASGAYATGRISPRWEAALMDFHDRIRRSFSASSDKN